MAMTDRLIPASNHTRLGYAPEWMTFEIQQALEAIGGAPGHVRQKRVTVLRVAQALAAGEALSEKWSTAGWPSKGTWYGETRHGVRRPGWRDDPAVVAALELARKRAEWWANVREGRAVERTLDTIVAAAPAAAEQLVRIATDGVMAVRQGGAAPVEVAVKSAEVVRAINSLLDRADARTAVKAPTGPGLAPEVAAALERVYG
jgi:hypothetical protein